MKHISLTLNTLMLRIWNFACKFKKKKIKYLKKFEVKNFWNCLEYILYRKMHINSKNTFLMFQKLIYPTITSSKKKTKLHNKLTLFKILFKRFFPFSKDC